MRVLILGKNGMLGRYVNAYMYDKYEVIATTRNNLDAMTVNKRFIASNIRPGDVVINCIGLIKQKEGAIKLDFVVANSMFPLLLQEACKEQDANLIHVTTDCVFDGLDGNYTEQSSHNAVDVYGVSKSLGEPEDACVIRTSIIGEELKGKLSLLEWIKSQANKEVNGYTNHYWNGITCLQFAKICEDIIEKNLFWTGVKHIFSPTSVNKMELVQMISDIYNLNITVNPFETPEKCDRTMSSIRNDIVIEVPEIKEQITEMKEFYK